MVKPVLRYLVSPEPGQHRVSLQDVAFSTVGGSSVAGVFRNFIGADARRRAVQKAVVLGLRRRMPVEELGGSGDGEAERHGRGDEGEDRSGSESIHDRKTMDKRQTERRSSFRIRHC